MVENTKFDVTSIGSTMIRLSVPSGDRLESADVYSVHTAGTEGNTLTALSRMGKKTAWVSRLKRDALGQRIKTDIHKFGVDTSRIIWTELNRNEVFYVEYGASPRGIKVIYDRSGSALSNIQWEEIDSDYLLNTRFLHMTGILPALSDNCRMVTHKAMAAAREAGVKVSFDVNYRSNLWSPEEAGKTLKPLMGLCDILFLTREDAEDLFDISGEPEHMLQSAMDLFLPEICVITLGGKGAVASDGTSCYSQKAYPVEIIDRLGAGDSFTAGFLYGYLEGSIDKGLQYGLAMAALKLGIKSDYFISNREEVLRLIDSSGKREIGR
jgi:2-dehydro-3-deoxygluconokinase